MLLIMTPGQAPAYGQHKPVKHLLDTVTIFHDVFTGVITSNGVRTATTLRLDHKQYCDDGNFSISETNTGTPARLPRTASGEWTVLRGDAKDENATVVELDAPGRVLYYLRKRDGSLQQLDTALKEIKPAGNYLLKKTQTTSSVPARKQTTAGIYYGSMPCADCNRVETALTLLCSGPCRSGSYTQRDKYVGTPKGDHAYTRKGRWHMDTTSSPTNMPRTLIVLDGDKPGHPTFYWAREDGSLLPLDENKNPADMPFDGSLKKK
jgi:NlpE-like protein